MFQTWYEKIRARRIARRKARKEAHARENREAIKELKADLDISRNEGDFITTKEASEILGKNQNVLQKLRAKGEGPEWQKVGSKVYYRKKDVEEWSIQNSS